MPDDKEKEYRPPQTFTLESTFRSVQPSGHPQDIEALIRDAKEEKAERTIREMNEG